MTSLKKRAVFYSLIIVLGLLSALPSLLPAGMQSALPGWYAQNELKLGLDLRGGSRLLLEVDVEQLMLDRNRQTADELAARLREAGIRYGQARVTEDAVVLPARDPSDLDEMGRLARELEAAGDGPRPYDIRARDGALLLELTAPHRLATVDDAVEQSLEVVRRRLDESGINEPTITRQGDSAIEVQLPGVDDPARIRELLGTTAKMDFHWQALSGASDVLRLPGIDPEQRYTLEREVAMEGRHVVDAQVAYDQQTGEPVVNFRLDNPGGRRFGEMTSANVGRPLAVVLDGKVITAPVIRTPILGGSGEISGGFSTAAAADLAVMLRAGALPAELNVGEEGTVKASLGSDSIRMGIASGIAGGLLVLAFMLVSYGVWGLIAWAGLAVNIGLIFGVLSVLGATLSLPGIAGIILAMGMAVDANILINERIRDETRRGRSAWQALELGFSKAWGTILDSSVTTLIAVSLLFMIGSGPVRGFAVTMGIGLLTSLFSAVAVCRLLMEWRVRRGPRGPLRMGGLPALARLTDRLGSGEQVIRFMRAGAAGLIVSAVLSAASLVLMVKPGMEYGIDFSGGALVEAQIPAIGIEDLREAMAEAGLPGLGIQEMGGGEGFQLRLPVQEAEDAEAQSILDGIKDVVLQAYPEAEFSRTQMVGPRVSGDFADFSILAVLTAGIGMLAYLWVRFENHFALAAVLTIGLDLTKTVGFFVISGVEFNLTAVAALLALIGYSMNDKVVVFDRIRENLRGGDGSEPLESVLDRSITSTLSRTLMTSGSTFIALLPMAVFGGEAVASFALPLLFGIVVGTSSSIFIAAPILLRLGRRREKLGLPQLAAPEEVVLEGEVLRP